MNYRLIELNGLKTWAALIYNKETKKIETKPISGPIILDANNFYIGDEISTITNPPPSPDNCIPIEELISEINTLVKKNSSKQFEPYVYYPYVYYCSHSPGQALEVYLTSEESFAKWINPHLTVYYSFENESKIVGFRIDNLTGLKIKSECN